MNEYADLQPKEATVPARAVPPVVHEVLRSPGQQLDTSTRSAVEPRFGHDFSRVRVEMELNEEWISENLGESRPLLARALMFKQEEHTEVSVDPSARSDGELEE